MAVAQRVRRVQVCHDNLGTPRPQASSVYQVVAIDRSLARDLDLDLVLVPPQVRGLLGKG